MAAKGGPEWRSAPLNIWPRGTVSRETRGGRRGVVYSICWTDNPTICWTNDSTPQAMDSNDGSVLAVGALGNRCESVTLEWFGAGRRGSARILVDLSRV